MKAKTVLTIVAMTVALSTMGSECINSPFTVVANLDAIQQCYPVDQGSGTWIGQSDPIVISDLIDENFEDDITGYRLFDIRVKVTGPYPDGEVSGNLKYSFDSQPFQEILTFVGQSSQFKGSGVSFLNPGDLITINQAALNAFVAVLNQSVLPQSIVLMSQGSGPPVPVGVSVCFEVFVQADAQID